MREIILNQLRQIEEEHRVKILYALESGSRAWGFESTDSDYDVRFIYIHTKDWYLSLNPGRDVIELPIDKVLDINGWDIKKALVLFSKSNPTFLEWLDSPIVYMENPLFVEKMAQLRGDYFADKSCVYHYLSMAKGNYREHLQAEMVKIKKYFYVIRPLLACQWVERYQSQPPMLFESLIKAFEKEIPQPVYESINQLLMVKKNSPEIHKEAQIKPLNEFIEERLSYFEAYAKQLLMPPKRDVEDLNQAFLTLLDTTDV